jgi:hypothetical protein
VLVHLSSVAGVEPVVVRNASTGQVRLEVAPDGAASKDFGYSCSRGKAECRPIQPDDPMVDCPEMRACGRRAGLIAFAARDAQRARDRCVGSGSRLVSGKAGVVGVAELAGAAGHRTCARSARDLAVWGVD